MLNSHLTKCVFSGLVIIFSGLSWSSPPMEQDRASLFVVRQSDGSELKVRRLGDAYFHWLENASGEVIIKNAASGDYEFATIKKDTKRPILVPSGINALYDIKGNSAHKTEVQESKGVVDKFVPLLRDDIVFLRKTAVETTSKNKLR